MSAHGFEIAGTGASPEARALSAARAAHPVLGVLQATLTRINTVIVVAASIALVAASVILSYSVVIRLLFHAPTYWQDEASVFLLVGATFMTAAYVQGRRGHVAIEALTALLPPRVNAARLLLVDLASLAFCAFFSWKSFTLLHEAWEDGHVSSSTWGPPMWIPYSVMTLGMSLLTLQIALQAACALLGGRRS
ncbi:TRAP transporter small permease [Azorhizobium doebereinerae]|uniref:TRAP transporter small permease n=1 Tax=Azorhizobium doebereinerae TaxID=281091 RepID=UPI000418F791|nr:TRAP transporter small permease [Azorhizobium doebereinerae]